jgi:hypothetical protein
MNILSFEITLKRLSNHLILVFAALSVLGKAVDFLE